MAAGAKDLARALRDHSRRQIAFHAAPPQLAVVTSADPLGASLVGSSVELDDSELVLTQSARTYDEQHGIEVGDSLVLHQMKIGGYIVSDVVAEKNTKVGAGAHVATPGAVATANGNVIAQIEAFDANGDHLGWIPVYASLHS